MNKLLPVLMVLSAFGSAQDVKVVEPLKIHGIYLGESVAEYSAAASGLKDSQPGRAPTLQECSKIPKKYRDNCELEARAELGERVEIRRTLTLPLRVIFDKGHVVDFTEVIMPDSSAPITSPWPKALFDLKQALGSPTDDSPIIRQNGFGARFEYSAARWTKDKFIVGAEESPLNNSRLVRMVTITVTDKAFAKDEVDYSKRPSSLE